MLCLARLMRWAIVASGTRNALAICAVVETADGAQGERELGGRRQRGVAAQEQQDQRVVPIRPAVVPGSWHEELVGGHLCRGRVLAAPASLLVAQLVGHPPRRDGDQPAPGALGHPLVGPLNGGGEQRLLHRVLARVEVPVASDERAEDLRREPVQQVLDARVRPHISVPPPPMSGRSSTAQYRASGQRVAISVARSALSHWNRQ